MTATRPGTDEYAHAYAGYIARVPDGDIVATLERQNAERNELLRSVSSGADTLRYAEGKWSVREVIGHLIDGERVFSYRALCIARGDTTPLPGFDENNYILASAYDAVPIADLAAQLNYLRLANVAFFRALTDEAWLRRGTANDNSVSVRAIAFTMAGHELHHLSILRERYLPLMPADTSSKPAVSGIGGIFFKSPDPKALSAWYTEHLGFAVEDWGGSIFKWRALDAPQNEGYTVWSPFKEASDYFAPSEARFMINYRVEALDALLEKLRAAGVRVDEKRDDSEFGKFGWIFDPDGNKIELWQPPK
jgi:catechol 2,3-dioxygenase-like lactoylglutathione lyase family enzyme